MSARQSKKQRKGRNNAINRERTVTTLTEDPNTPYLVPTPSEEPAGVIMSSPFSTASSTAGNQPLPSQNYQVPGSFSFGFNNNNFVSQMHPNLHQQHSPQSQNYYSSQQPAPISLPPGANDVEILEKLKEIIKSNQHPVYKAIPQPAYLASLYLGPKQSATTQVPYHPEQAPSDSHDDSKDEPSQTVPDTSSNPSSPVDVGRRPPRMQNKEGWDLSVARKSAAPLASGSSQPSPNVLFTSSPNMSSTADPSTFPQSAHDTHSRHAGTSYREPLSEINTSNLNDSSGPVSAGEKTSNDPSHSTDSRTSPMTASAPSATDTPSAQRQARFGSGVDTELQDRLGLQDSGFDISRSGSIDNVAEDNNFHDHKTDVPGPVQESSWSPRDGPQLSNRRLDADRSIPSGPMRSNSNGGSFDTQSGVPGDRGVLPYPRDYVRDRDDHRDKDRFRRDWQVDNRDRDRRPYDRFYDSSRMTDMRRPPPEQRHYEPEHDRRRYRSYPMPSDLDTIPLPYDRQQSDDRPPSIDERGVHPSSSTDDRLISDLVDSRPPAGPRPQPDSRALESRVSQAGSNAHNDDRDARTISSDKGKDSEILPMDITESRPPVTAVRSLGSAPSAAIDDHAARGTVPSPTLVDTRSQVPLEDRISKTIPTLQDRLSQPPVGRFETEQLSRPGSLEGRLSHPSGAPIAEQSSRSLPLGDASRSAAGTTDDRNQNIDTPLPPHERQEDGRPGDRFSGPITPTSANNGPLMHRSAYPRSASVDNRMARGPLQYRRDFRPPVRDMSRDRGNFDRGFQDDRRPGPMDIDGPRYGETRQTYPNRQYMPLANPDRTRPNQPFGSAPRTGSLDSAPYDDPSRRFQGGPGGRDWQYNQGGQFDNRRRDWGTPEEETYWKNRPHWERNGPPPVHADRERFEREMPPRWEMRQGPERELRETFPRVASPRPFEAGRPLSARLTDGYSGPGLPDERSYPPLPPSRDAERGRVPTLGHAPPYSRVRPRSSSPSRRPPVDDSRPPLKRPREEYSPNDYYAHPAREPMRRTQAEYPPRRGGSPGPPPGSGGYYERPPPSSASTTASGPPEREYPSRGPGGLEYPIGSYERPPVSGPSGPPPARIGPGPGYGRGGYIPRERGYMLPPRGN